MSPLSSGDSYVASLVILASPLIFKKYSIVIWSSPLGKKDALFCTRFFLYANFDTVFLEGIFSLLLNNVAYFATMFVQ